MFLLHSTKTASFVSIAQIFHVVTSDLGLIISVFMRTPALSLLHMFILCFAIKGEDTVSIQIESVSTPTDSWIDYGAYWSFRLCPSFSVQIARAASARWTRWTLPATRTTVTASRTKGSQVRREKELDKNTDERCEGGQWQKRRGDVAPNTPKTLLFQLLRRRCSLNARPPPPPPPPARLDAGAESVLDIFGMPGWNHTPSSTMWLVEHQDVVWALSLETDHRAEGTSRYTSPTTSIHCYCKAKSVLVESLMSFQGGNVKKRLDKWSEKLSS